MENVNYKELYHNALDNPAGIDDNILSTLIDRFPYAQSLRIVQARKNSRANDAYNSDSAPFITGLPHWLCGYILADIQPAEQPFTSVGDAAPETGDAPTESGAMATGIKTVTSDIDESGLIEHPVGMDYFAYAEKEADGTDTTPADGSQDMVPISEATPHEKVSLYNDEHLPYSFLWWLDKTRMEHADTYRPYAPDSEPAIDPVHSVDTPDDERVLDHQIRENIFHLQSPEDKLSTGVPTETVPFQIPKKTDPIIERFIREEPQIKPPQADKINLENKARRSAEDQLTLVTETLANIYVEQGLYPKAIAIYKKLSLKYPEKSTYFAARIIELTNKL